MSGHARVIVGIALVSVLVLVVGAQVDKPAGSTKFITAERLVIVNSDGVPVIELSTSEGRGQITLRTAANTDVVSLTSDPRGGSVRVQRSDGKPAAAMYTYQVSDGKTAGMIENFDFAGAVAVSIGSGDNDPGPTSMGAGPGGVVAIDWEGGPRRLDAPLIMKLRRLLDEGK